MTGGDLGIVAPGALSQPRETFWTSSAGETPARLLFLAVVWFVGATLAGIATAFVLGFAAGVHNQASPATAWHIARPVYGFVALIVADLLLILAALGRGEIVGNGNIIAGLGGASIQRPRLLVLLAALNLVCAPAWAWLLAHWLSPETGLLGMIKDALSLGRLMQGAILLSVVGLSPLWEELFFRGWLWTGLQRWWQPVPVMLTTGTLWLLLHGMDGLSRPLFLIPGAIFISLARHYCGGIRASLTLHVLNNLTAMVLIGFALLFAHR
jgi:membrane protease YdiL (CAAX protease family)